MLSIFIVRIRGGRVNGGEYEIITSILHRSLTFIHSFRWFWIESGFLKRSKKWQNVLLLLQMCFRSEVLRFNALMVNVIALPAFLYVPQWQNMFKRHHNRCLSLFFVEIVQGTFNLVQLQVSLWKIAKCKVERREASFHMLIKSWNKNFCVQEIWLSVVEWNLCVQRLKRHDW